MAELKSLWLLIQFLIGRPEEWSAWELAYRILRSKHFVIRVGCLFHVLKPQWDWYTAQVETIKSPDDNLRYWIYRALVDWNHDPEILEFFTHCLGDVEKLDG